MLLPIPRTPAAEVVLSSTFTLTGSNGTFQDTGLSVSLPGAGTYLLIAQVRTALQITGGSGWITTRLYNATDAAAVANSEGRNTASTTTNFEAATNTFVAVITVSAAKTIRLDAARDNATGYTYSLVESDSLGRTKLAYVRLLP